MSDQKQQQMKVFMELGDLLTPPLIQKLENALNVPARICEKAENDPIKFLYALKEWEHFNPALFDEALEGISGNILSTARQLKWLSNPHYKHPTTGQQPRSVETFVQLLADEITSKEWMVLTDTSSEVEESNIMLKLCLDNELITRDMNYFCECLKIVRRDDLALQVNSYVSIFKTMTREYFHEQIKSVIEQNMNLFSEEWEVSLRKYIKKHNKDVSVVLNESTVPIESVYIPLTVVKIKPAEERLMEESGINEINFLRNMHHQVSMESIEIVNFEAILTTCNSSDNTIWCMIGSPGSGKSFLCKHFAYMYGIDLLANFQYTVSIPCRSREWHTLEEARHEGKKDVDAEFIVSWLCLSMSPGAKWSESLSHHLIKFDGEGLLIIIDGADEFTRNVPFEETLLCKILQRRILTRSSILITSRPSAWTELHLNYGSQFQVDGNFQVLGFSPANRDLYFQKRINSPSKLNEVYALFARHDEIKQLALVPVNASLFSSLFNESESILTQTLSHLYTHLIVYTVRRQLSRLGIKEQTKVVNISDFHSGVRECINAIGKEANQGIFEREMTSDKIIFLKIGKKVYQSDRLGLMHAHIKIVRFGVHVKVWTFQHLTIQEFMAALSICVNSWTNQCFIIRYITSSTQYLSMYKMVVRFVSGILKHDAGAITPILCRHMLPSPLSLHEAPMIHQLHYQIDLVDISNWGEFTQSFLLLCTIITEISSSSIPEHFAYFKEQFPYPLYLYFHSTISPNDWHCFLQSLQYINEFKIIQIHSDFVSDTQFGSFLTKLPSSCRIHYIALVFVEEDFNTIKSYTSLFTSTSLPLNTRISVEFSLCNLTDRHDSQHLFTGTNRFIGSLMVDESEIKQQMLQNLTNQFSSLEHLYYSPKQDDSDWPIIQQILPQYQISIHQIIGLYIDDPEGYLPFAPTILSDLSSLEEFYWSTKGDPYKALPYLLHLTSLSDLDLFSTTYSPPDESQLRSIAQLISTNSHSLKQITLTKLHNVGLHTWDSFFSVVTACSNLMILQLSLVQFSSDDISCWYRAVSVLKSLVVLQFIGIPLQDKGMLVLCHSLSYHPALRKLFVQSCDLTSASCEPLSCLVQTLSHIQLLKVEISELSSPDPTQLELLTQIVEECSVKIKLL